MWLARVGDLAKRHFTFNHRTVERGAHDEVGRQRPILRQLADSFVAHPEKHQSIARGGHGGLGGLKRALGFAKRLGLLCLSGLESGGSSFGIGFDGDDVAGLLRLGLRQRCLGRLHIGGGRLHGGLTAFEFRGGQRAFDSQFFTTRKQFRCPLQNRFSGIELAFCLSDGGGIIRQGQRSLGGLHCRLSLRHARVVTR